MNIKLRNHSVPRSSSNFLQKKTQGSFILLSLPGCPNDILKNLSSDPNQGTILVRVSTEIITVKRMPHRGVMMYSTMPN